MENGKILGKMTQKEAERLASGLINTEIYKLVFIKNRNDLLKDIEKELRNIHTDINNPIIKLNDVLAILSCFVITKEKK